MRLCNAFSPHTFIALLLSLALPLLTSCKDDDDDYPDDEGVTAHRTVIVYMAAQNSLGGKYLQHDLDELLEGRGAVPDDCRLLVFVDNGAPCLYRVSRRSESYQLLRTWADDVASHYPAADYGLVMWSHADGWLPATDTNYANLAAAEPRPLSFGIDTGQNPMSSDVGTQMNIDDMAAAIAASGIRPSYIFFDACLMQSLETAWALRDVTDYIVASPIATPAEGANYVHQIASGLFSDNPADIAATYYADVTDPEQYAAYGSYGIVMSVVQTNRLPALAQAIANALPASASAGRTSVDMAGVLNYQTYTKTYYYRPHHYDAQQALERLLTSGADLSKALQALDDAIVYRIATPRFYIGPGSIANKQTVDLDRYCGVAMFVPGTIYTANAQSCPWGDLNQAFQQTAWYEAAQWPVTGW